MEIVRSRKMNWECVNRCICSHIGDADQDYCKSNKETTSSIALQDELTIDRYIMKLSNWVLHNGLHKRLLDVGC